MLGPKTIKIKKNFDPKSVRTKIILVPKKNWVQKMLGLKIFSQKKLWVKKNFGSKKIVRKFFWVKNTFLVQQNLDPKILSAQKFWAMKYFWPKHFGSKNLTNPTLA